MRIVVAGAGAMGCRFGGLLAESGQDVLLLDGWAEHVDAIRSGGLRITDSRGSRTVRVRTRSFPSVPDDRADLVIVFGKATQTASLASAASEAIGPDTLVLTLQNGLGNLEVLGSYVPADRLLAGTTTLGTELLGPGHIRALGSGETVFGSLAGPGSSHTGPGSGSGSGHRREVARVRRALADADLAVRTCSDPRAVIWSKVAFNCVMNSLCSLASIPVSALARYDGFDALARSVLDEIAAVAAASDGVTVDTGEVLALMRAQFSPSASGDHLASTLQDLMRGRPTEIAHLNGAVAARAAAHGVPAPVNQTITRLITLLESTWPSRITSLDA